jgi:hypothetical protein
MESIESPLVYEETNEDLFFKDIDKPTFVSPQIIKIPLPKEIQEYLYKEEQRFLEYLNRENPCNLINNDEVEQDYIAYGYFVTMQGKCDVYFKAGRTSTI